MLEESVKSVDAPVTSAPNTKLEIVLSSASIILSVRVCISSVITTVRTLLDTPLNCINSAVLQISPVTVVVGTRVFMLSPAVAADATKNCFAPSLYVFA